MKKISKLTAVIIALTLLTTMAAPAAFAQDYTMDDIKSVYYMVGSIVSQSSDEIVNNISDDEDYLCASVIKTIESMFSSGMDYSQQEINTAYDALDATFSMLSLIIYRNDTTGKREEIIKQVGSQYAPQTSADDIEALYDTVYTILYDKASVYYSGMIQSVFDDVSEDDWFFDAASFVFQSGLFKGTDEHTFSPAATMTRAMLVTVISRFEGGTTVTYNNEFEDIAGDEYYAAPVAWAKNKGCIPWATDSQFYPDKPITREEIASTLYSTLRSPDVDTSYADNIKDKDSISEYAKNAVYWAYSTGIIKGYEDGTVRAQGTATRAEVAQLILNYTAVVFAPAE